MGGFNINVESIDFYKPQNKIGTTSTKYVDPSALTNVPEAEADLPIPYLYGQRRIDNPNTIDCGKPVTTVKQITRVIEEEPFQAMALLQSNTVAPKFTKLVHGRVTSTKTGSLSIVGEGNLGPATETVEYIETRVTFAIGVAMGPGVRIIAIKDEDDTRIFGDTSNSEVMDTDGDSYTLRTTPDQSSATFYSGSFTQDRDPDLTALPDRGVDRTPAYRGTSYLVFPNALVSNAGIIASLSFEAVRLPNPLGLTEAINESPTTFDASIPNCVYDLLSSTWGGVGLNTIFIDPVSFTQAAETLAAEGIFVSVLITSRAGIKSVLASLLETAGGALRWNPKTAYIEFILFREDYDVLAIPLFNEDNVESVQGFDKTTWYSLPQATQIVYNDRDTRYKPTPVRVAVSKLVPQHAARVYSETYDFICEPEIALKVLVREFGKYAAPFLAGDINTNRDGFEVMPGEVIRLSWASFAGIVNFPMRVVSIKEKGTLLDTLTLNVQQASYSFKSTVFAPPQSEATEQTIDIPTPDEATAFVLPYALAARRNGISIVSPKGGGLNSATGFFYIRCLTDAENFTTEYYDPTDFRLYVAVASGIRARFGSLMADVLKDTGYVDGYVGDVFITGPNVAGVNLNPDASLGEGVFFIGNEIFTYDHIQETTPGEYTLQDVRRGLIDTIPEAHVSGAEVLFLNSYSNISRYGFDATGNPYDLYTQSTDGFNKSALGVSAVGNVTPRFNLPAAPHNTMVAATPGANVSPRPAGPQAVARSTDYYVSWKRRDRLNTGIAYRADADEPTLGTTYTLTLIVGAYTAVLATGVAAAESLVTIPVGATLGAGTIQVKATSPQGDSLYSDYVNITVTT